MKVLKKFWMILLALIPTSASALNPVIIGTILGATGIVGVSIWRSFSPVDMKEAYNLFSSCWTCQIFSDIMLTMSKVVPNIYKSLGHVIIPMAASLLAVLMAWQLLSGFLNNKLDSGSKIAGNFGTYAVRLTVLISLMLMPLPKLVSDVFVEPALDVGTSIDYVLSDTDEYSKCLIATTVADPTSVETRGAFSPGLRHKLACQIANVHQVTGLGLTVGWTFFWMAFDVDNMHKILDAVPFFPNIPMGFIGGLLVVIYLFALLPIPLYFLEIFVKLSLDLVMLPLMLMSWMFDDDNFAIFPKGGRTIRQMIDDVIKAVVGIALTVVCLSFSTMFINAALENWSGMADLKTAISTGNSEVFTQALMMNNSSLITLIVMGVFIAMFMTMIPQLTNMLFSIQISDKYYQTAKSDIGNMWKGLKSGGQH